MQSSLLVTCFSQKLSNKNVWGVGSIRLGKGRVNPVQVGVFWNHIGWEGGGAHCARPQFLLYLLSNHHQTLHGSNMAQNLSKTVKFNPK